jgi:hypothetical protein
MFLVYSLQFSVLSFEYGEVVNFCRVRETHHNQYLTPVGSKLPTPFFIPQSLIPNH